ncbi:hypothetical protein RRG08_009639 [Elysia crispata]|uniref:Uncharacterized protein n=1 Tax=Elysia crispata TaxID=231223 RepID=A0AAE0XTC2_9GAST|nr:hypothetical protein RRG08_009639 [Elysia crispata]
MLETEEGWVSIIHMLRSQALQASVRPRVPSPSPNVRSAALTAAARREEEGGIITSTTSIINKPPQRSVPENERTKHGGPALWRTAADSGPLIIGLDIHLRTSCGLLKHKSC